MRPEPRRRGLRQAQATAALVRGQHPQPAHTRLNGRSSRAHRRSPMRSRRERNWQAARRSCSPTPARA